MPMKLPNGYGSVTKLSGNRRNPYMARVTLGRDDYGRLVRKTLGYYHTRKEALSALANYNRDPYDLAAEPGEFSDLGEGRRGVAGVGVGHRLNRNRGAAADRDVSDPDLPAISSGCRHGCSPRPVSAD